MRRLLIAVVLAGAVASIGLMASAGAAPRGGNEPFVFGVIPQLDPSESDLRQMSRGGVESVRIGMFWPRIEPEYERFEWRAFDEVVGAAARSGLRLFPYLYGTPGWAANYDGVSCTDKCTPYAPSSPDTRAAFAGFAAAAARRYGPGGHFWNTHRDLPYRPIGAWQIWNEQNSPKYYAPAPDVTGYAELVARAGQAIRGVDPNAEIVLGGMWGPNGSNEVISTAKYLRRLYRKPGAKGNFDSLGVHPYAPGASGVLKQLRAVRRAVRRSGDPRVPIWISELGWASRGPSDSHLVKGRRGQAKVLADTYDALLERRDRWRLRGAFWYAWRDTPPGSGYICDWCPGAGLRKAGGGSKPAWRELKRFARAG